MATVQRTSLLRPLVEDLEARRAKIKLGGGEEKIAKQHAEEKLTARERLALLIDQGTFTELGIHGRPHSSQRAMEGREVFVHLDCDVLDPSVMPARFEATGGLSDGGLRTLLTEVAEATSLIGCEITAFGSPELAERVAAVVEPLLPLKVRD